MKAYRVIFVVEGTGQLPLPLLREEAAFPASTESAGNLAYDGYHSVTMTAIRHKQDWQPDKDRWNAYGWIVTKVSPSIPY